MQPFVYRRMVQYYETDCMQVVHHSNYIRWMEEARTAYMKEMGVAYDAVEKSGIMLPVLSVECKYHIPLQYGDTFLVQCHVREYNGVRLGFVYEIYKEGESRCCASGTSLHCFVGADDRKPTRLQWRSVELHEQFVKLLEQE